VALGDFDAAEGWDLDAATSATAWLRTQAGMTAGDAVGAVQVAERTVELFAGHEAELVALLAPLAAADVATAMRQWKALAEDSLDDDDKGEPESSLHLSSLLQGRWRLDGDLGALDGEMLATALGLASAKDAEGKVRTPAQHDATLEVTDPSGRTFTSEAPIQHPRPPPELFDVA
jgi:hypothetical protein